MNGSIEVSISYKTFDAYNEQPEYHLLIQTSFNEVILF